MYGRYTPTTFSGVNSCLKTFSANIRRLSTNWRMRTTAYSFMMRKGSTASGTAPFATCSFTPKTCRHQWQRAVIELSVLTVTSAPQPVHLKLIRLAASAAMACAPDAITVPCSSSRPTPSPKASSTPSPCHSLRQNRQISMSVPVRCRMSVAPHFGQWFWPSLSSSEPVSMATGSGARISSRIGSGRVAGSTGKLPGGGGTSCGEPGPMTGGKGGGVGTVCLDIVEARPALQAQRLGFERVVITLRDQAEVEHLLGLCELGDRIIGRRRGWRHWLLQGADAAEHARRHAHAHQACRTAGLAGRLHACGDAGLQVGIAAGTGQRIGALHGLEQFPCVGVVLDGNDGGLDDGQAPVGAPLVGVLDRSRQALGE